MWWYEKAAAQGHIDAQLNLGNMYRKGQGVPQDDVEAYKWTSIAGGNGDAGAKRNLELLEKKMTPERIAEAQRRARDWINAHK